jgi:hypothetical protein
MQENRSETCKVMNNGDTVAKKDFTASFKSKKRRGFLMIHKENLA